MASHPRDTDGESGRRIWQDLEACADLFLQVNHRAELLEHDDKLVQEILPSLSRLPRSGPPPEEISSRLRLLLGRDAAVDELIERSPKPSVEEWVRAVEELRRGLRRGSGAAAPVDPAQSKNLLETRALST
jgi:hypothetical protein